MNKNIFKIILTIGLLATLSICVAFASNIQATDKTSFDAVELTQIESSINIEGQTILKNAFGEKNYIDENGDICTSSSSISETYNFEKIYKSYSFKGVSSIFDGKSVDSIYDNTSEEFNYIVPIENSGELVGFATIKKGKSIDEVTKKLADERFSTLKDKDKIIERAKNRENKWYVSSIQKLDLNKSLRTFNNYYSIDELISLEGITDVQDIKHISVGIVAKEIISIKTSTKEYAIPFGVRSDATKLEEGKIYNASEVISAIKEAVKESK